MSLDPTGIVSALNSFFSAVGQLFGFAGKRSDLNNAPDVKAAAESEHQAKQDDRARAAIANKDTNEIRNELAE